MTFLIFHQHVYDISEISMSNPSINKILERNIDISIDILFHTSKKAQETIMVGWPIIQSDNTNLKSWPCKQKERERKKNISFLYWSVICPTLNFVPFFTIYFSIEKGLFSMNRQTVLNHEMGKRKKEKRKKRDNCLSI